MVRQVLHCCKCQSSRHRGAGNQGITSLFESPTRILCLQRNKRTLNTLTFGPLSQDEQEGDSEDGGSASEDVNHAAEVPEPAQPPQKRPVRVCRHKVAEVGDGTVEDQDGENKDATAPTRRLTRQKCVPKKKHVKRRPAAKRIRPPQEHTLGRHLRKFEAFRY